MLKYLLVGAALLAASPFAQAQNAPYYSQEPAPPAPYPYKPNAVKLYPFAFVKSRMAVTYERAIGKDWSVQAGAGLTSSDQSFVYNDARNIFGYSAELQVRKYVLPGKAALSGFYVAPHLAYKHIELEQSTYYYNPPYSYPDTSKATSSTYTGGMVMGYQFVILKTIAADVYAGGGYRYANDNQPMRPNYQQPYYYEHGSLPREYSSTGVYPVIGFQLGLVF